MGLFSKDKRCLETIPVQLTDMDAAYLGAQYTACDCRHRPMYGVIKNSIKRIIFSNFAWEGLTPIESRFIERSLIMYGRVAAVKSKFDIENRTPDGVYFGKINIYTDKFDFYGQPYGEIGITGLNGIEIKSKDYAIGYDTTACNTLSAEIPPIYTVIDKLTQVVYEAYSAWVVARETSKSSTIITTNNHRSAKIIRTILNAISENNPYIVLENDPAMENITTDFRNNTEHVKVFYDNYINSWGMVLDILGCENAAPNKHERMIVGEMELNQSFSKYISADRMQAREMFADLVKEKCGKTITPYNYLHEIIHQAEMEDLANEMDGNANTDNISSMEGTAGDK